MSMLVTSKCLVPVLACEILLYQVKMPLYGCDCYAYALLASGFVDLVIESGLKVKVLLQNDTTIISC